MKLPPRAWWRLTRIWDELFAFCEAGYGGLRKAPRATRRRRSRLGIEALELRLAPNTAPIANDPVVAQIHQGDTLALGLDPFCSDPDGDSFTVIVMNPSHGTILPAPAPYPFGCPTYVPDSGFVGTDTVPFKANDGELDSNIAYQTIEVLSSAPTQTNQSPTFTNPGTLHNNELDSVTQFFPAVDPDGDPLTYSASGLPPGLAINSSTGMVTGFLDNPAAGTYDVTITADDGQAGPASMSLTWVVYPPLKVIATADPSSAHPGDTITFTATASDGSGSGYTYDWDIGATGSTATDVFSPGVEGDDYEVTVTAHDDAGNEAVFTVVVAAYGDGEDVGDSSFDVSNDDAFQTAQANDEAD